MKSTLARLLLGLLALALPVIPMAGQDVLVRQAPVGMRLRPIDAPEVRHFLPHTNEREEAHLNNMAERITDLLDEAFRHIGAHYRSGGKGPKVFDCSGFTSYVFGRMGRVIGHSSRDQYARNIPVKNEDIQRGDLVFFTSGRSGKNVGHVGIVVNVDPTTKAFTFIHASTSGGVRVDKSTDGYYARRFIGVRRVF